ncbi:Wzz/FepE/Etk N-terminal domain-containing protein [Sphingobium sufflavum]|uniref:XrtA system polysaccharide chain length determinant n=1 Tax=Sphingobium sufflavum TaxID=1129547 RepID=UPI001F36CB49|nr:XrtA system polysaccharide chain length determinant [Sphingobium sufflavum]MCE7797386.1 Wzz/FepE/Etk N-terminal domain-containing protein [Sphingobium sufflavum]
MTSIYEEVQIAIHGIWSRRWLALAVAWGVALLGWLVVSLIPNSYESRARVYIEAQSILSPTPGTAPVDQMQQLDQIRQTLTSVDNLVQVVKGTDLAKTVQTDRDIGDKVSALKANITIVSQQNNMFEIAAKSADRSMSDRQNAIVSQQVVNKLLDILGQENMTGGKATTSQTLRILDGQIQARAKDLANAEQRRVDFEQKNIGMLPGSGSIGTRIDQTRGELSQIESQIMAAQSELAGINGQLASTPQTIDVGGGGGTAGVSPLGQAMGELAQARARGWTDSHPDVVAIKRQIAALRGAGSGTGSAATMTRTPNPAYIQLRSLQTEKGAALSALQARRGDLAGQMGGMTAKQVEEPGIAAEATRLGRDYDALKAQYDKLVADREETRLRGDVQSEAGLFRVRLIDPPGLPSAPAKPNRPLLLVGVLIAAIGAGLGLAFVLGQLQTTYATAGRLERATGIPVMGAISETLGAAAIAKRRRMLGILAGAGGGLFVMCLALVVLEFVQRGMAA